MAVKKIIGDTFEFIKDTGQKAGQIAPDILGGMIEQAVKGVGQTPAQKQQAAAAMQQKRSDFKQKDEEQLKKARDALAQLRRMQSTYAPSKRPDARPYDQNIAELEKKKAAQVEAAKKQPQPLAIPVSKQKRGSLFAAFSKKKNKGIEGMVKDTRVG